MNDRRLLITCLVFIVVACLLLTCAGIFGAGIYVWNSADSKEPISEILSVPQEEPQSLPEDETHITEAPVNPEQESPNDVTLAETIAPEIARQMDEIQMQVILERGLKPTQNVNRGLYSSEQLREKVLTDFFDEYSPEDAQLDAQSLAAFGLLQPDFDLYTFYIDLFSEQIAGFYDQETQEMVVVQGDGFGGPERLTYAHEYTHALQDQVYDIKNGLNYNDEACEQNSEGCAAVQALIEGDASLAELNWFFANSTPEDQAEIMAFYNSFESPIFDSAPEFISMDFTFPYEYGYAFVEHLYNIGGWGTVDRAYQNLPQSTEQILHPERYPDDQPIPITLSDLAEAAGSGWEEIDSGTMGEWYTYLILAKGLDMDARLSEDEAAQAAEGWGGDAYRILYNAATQQTIMVLHTAWDTEAEASEFTEAFQHYAEGRFGMAVDGTWQGEDGFHTLTHAGQTTTWILAPDAETGATILQNLSVE